MEMQFLLNGTDYGHPLNWRDVKIKYERDKSIHGLFTFYSSELQFVGKAYDYLNGLQATDVCSIVDVVINSRCSQFDTWSMVITGVMLLNEGKWDDMKCGVTLPIEQNGCIREFIKNADKKIPVVSTVCIDGETPCVLTPRQVINIQLYDGQLYNALGFPDNYGWNVGEMMAFMVKYLSNDCLSFESDFFANQLEHCEIELTITANPLVGDTFELVLFDEFTQITSTYRIVVTAGWQAVFINTTMMSSVSGTSTHVPADLLINSFESTYVPGAQDKIYLRFWSQKTVVSFTPGSGTGTAVVIQDYQSGGLDLFMSTSESLTDEDKWQFAKLSFREIFEKIRNQFDLGIQFIDTGGGAFAVKMEPIAGIYTGVSLLTLTNIKNVTKLNQEELIGKSFVAHMIEAPEVFYNSYNPPYLGSADYDFASIPITTQLDTDMPGCLNTIDRRVPDDVYIDMGALLDVQASEQDDLGQYFWFYFVDETTDVFRPFRYQVFDAVSFGGYYFPIRKNMADYHPVLFWNNLKASMPETYNIGGAGGALTTLWNFAAGAYTDSITSTGLITYPAGIAWNPVLWNFGRYISFSQFAAIVDTNQITLNQGTDPSDDVAAFIKSVEFRLSDGYTTFIMEAKT